MWRLPNFWSHLKWWKWQEEEERFFLFWKALAVHCKMSPSNSVTILGKIWKILVTNIRTKVAQQFETFCSILKMTLFKYKLLWLLFGHILKRIWLFYPTFGHTGFVYSKFFHRIDIRKNLTLLTSKFFKWAKPSLFLFIFIPFTWQI